MSQPILDPIKEEKRARLEALRKRMVNDPELPLRPANLVFGDGNPLAKVMFIGEAPGFHEDQQKKPFVGLSGKLLDKLFNRIGLPRREVYITNIVKRRPPENRDPSEDEIERYKPYLAEQIAIIEPKVIATLGRFSMNYFLPEAKISNDHGKPVPWEGKTIFALYHPAAAMRAGAVMRQLETDFAALGRLLGITPPPPPPKPVMAQDIPPPVPIVPVTPAEPPPDQFSLF